MTDDKRHPGGDPETGGDGQSPTGPQIRQRPAPHAATPAENPLARKLRQLLPPDLPLPDHRARPERLVPLPERPERPPPLSQRPVRPPSLPQRPTRPARPPSPPEHQARPERPPPVEMERLPWADMERPERYVDHPNRQTRQESPRSPAGKWLAGVLGTLLVCCAASGVWYVMTQSGGTPATAPTGAKSARSQPDADASEAVPEAARNTFWQQAQNVGATTCSRAASELGSIVTMGSNYALHSSMNKDAADRHAFQMVAGQSYNQQDFKAQAASVLFAAPVDGQCEANAVRIVPVAQSCAQMGQDRAMKGASKPQDMLGVALYEFPGNGNRIVLVPGPNDTCVVVSIIRSGG